MAEYTPYLNLKKPAPNEFYNVEDFNDNADLIDAEMGQQADGIGALQQTVNAHLAEHLRIEVGVSPPENPNSKTFWLEYLGESIDFVLGGGLLIGNASLDGSDDVWFDENV